MNDYEQYHNLDLRLCHIFSAAAIATQPADKRRVIGLLRAFVARAEREQRPELAADALRLEYDLVAELHQAGEPWPGPSHQQEKPAAEVSA